jgi:hypothetical protein
MEPVVNGEHPYAIVYIDNNGLGDSRYVSASQV